MRRRKTWREKRSRNKKIVIISATYLLLCLCVGYAAFSTQLSLKAKGNIKLKKASDMLRELCNTESGDGLYKDIFDEDRCIYRGVNPNNYIKFEGFTWRIISVEHDGCIKIMHTDPLQSIAWDNTNSNDWLRSSSLNEKLNHGNFNDKVVTYQWQIESVVNNNDDIETQILDEK